MSLWYIKMKMSKVMPLTPGDAVLWAALVISASGQTVSVRGAGALAVNTGALTGATPLATVVLRRKDTFIM